MSSCTMNHKYGRCTRQREQPRRSNIAINSLVVFNKTILPLAFVRYEIVIDSVENYFCNLALYCFKNSRRFGLLPLNHWK